MPDSERVESALAGISSDLAIMIGLFFFVVSMGVSYWADMSNRKVGVFANIIPIMDGFLSRPLSVALSRWSPPPRLNPVLSPAPAPPAFTIDPCPIELVQLPTRCQSNGA